MALPALLLALGLLLAPLPCLADPSPAELALPALLLRLRGSQFSGFLALLDLAGLADPAPLAEALARHQQQQQGGQQGQPGLTVFAPTDDALLYHTSPALLAWLKLPSNKGTLRQVLLSAFVPERLSPFQWDGEHATLSGHALPLAMDASAFYAAGVAVMQYNALVAGDAALHSVPALVVAPGLARGGDARVLLEQGTEARRALFADSPGPAPAPVEGAMGTADPAKGALARAAASLATAAAAVAGAAALLLC